MALKLFESMAAGVPVVVTDYPGMRDVIRQVRAVLVIPPQDPPALAAAVAKIVRWDNAPGIRGRQWVLSGHSWDARAPETDRELRRVVARKPLGATR